MATGNEILFGRIAVHNGVVTMEQLDECLGLQRSRAPSKHVGQIMIERGLIDDVQARAILAVQRRRLHKGTDRERTAIEKRLADLLLAEGAVEEPALERARRAQQEMEDRGLFPSLGDILVQQGAVGLGRLGELKSRLSLKPLRCASCGKKYRAQGYRAGIEARCRRCGGKLEPREEPPPPPPEGKDLTVAGPPERAPAESLESLDVKLPNAVRMRRPERQAFSPRVGEVVGGCCLESKIGEGGMGQVYLGRHLALDREVAVKILPARMMSRPHHVQRFLAEARAAARLDHPNIIVVHDVGEDGGVHYIVMQLVRGRPLKGILLEKGPFDLREALEIARQAADGLDYAHRSRIVHRDVKASNILVDDSGHVTIVDFGLTKNMGSDAHLTTAGVVVGTVQYMSPEQADGRPVDGRTDLYSLGVTLFEMLTGHVPFDGDSPWTVLLRQQREPAPDPALLRPGLPERVSKLVLRLLAKDPGARPASGEAVVEEVEGILADL